VSATPTDRFSRVDGIFDAVVDMPAGERTAFIDRECGGDAALRAEVLELVQAYHRSDSVLESPAARLAAPLLEATAAVAGPVSDVIGPFRVVREIGRGGMGRVFLGERADGQFDQRVAIKLIQHGAPGVLRRFVEERRILARLEHPGIARLVDGGITESGLPYFAMELVDGEPIDRYCDTHALTLDQRLALFGAVCDAVAYAHQHLVIHRDIKPSNILVTADGKVKLLDFGIAKLIGAHGDDDVTQTRFSAMTPEFAAPEQIRNGSVSTATDVYSLGVLLYLLITGERLYDVRGKSPAEIERIVCDEVPPRPSVKARPDAKRRLRGDLDLIVMTALQKAPERRYQTPTALAQDLDRFRHGHAILARPDSARYRLRKFVGRHRTAVTLAALLLLALAGAVARERALRHDAEVQARKAREVEDFLVGVFDVADPNAWKETEGGSVTARELLDRGARRIDSTLTGQQEVQSELRHVLGRVYTNLGLYDRAMPLLRASLAQRTSLRGPADTSVAETMDMLGVALTELNEHDQAEPLLRRALEQRRRLLGNAHPATARSAEHLATLLEARNQFAPAETLYREAVAIHRAAADSSVEVADALGSLGVLLARRARHAEAESLHRSALAINVRRVGEKHPSTTSSMQNLAAVLATRGSVAEAESLHRRALAAKRLVLGDTHPSVTISMNNLANLLTRQMDRFAEGESLVRRALVLDRAMYGDRHTFVAEGLANLGIILRILGRYPEADSALREALAINRSVFGARHGRVASNLSALAQVRSGMLDGAGAIEYMRQSSDMYRQLLGEEHLSTITTTISVGFLLAEFGDPVEGESILRRELRRLDPERGEHRAQVMSAELGIGKALLAQRRSAEAVPVLASAVGRLRARFGDGNWRTADGLITYGEALVAQRRWAEAERALREGRAAMARGPRVPPRMAARAAAAMARLPAGVADQGAR
jgi:serine/threonine-protein kinase